LFQISHKEHFHNPGATKQKKKEIKEKKM